MLKPTPRQHARTETDRLVHNFERQIAGHKLSAFNETQTRRDFLDPWLAALGWDTENRRNLPQPLREVYMEAQVLVEGKVKFPDYEFRIDGQPSFFLEAKKPSVNLHDDWRPANQIRLYSWSAKLPVGVLTDFEELSIYDCRHQPAYQDPADVARHKYLTYDTYLDHFDYLYDLLGREAVAAGALQSLAQVLPNQRGALSVDKAFLATLELMRERLAIALARHNRHLSAPELRFLVQALLDRIIFLRIAEDRGIEPYQNLLRVLDSAARLGAHAPYEALLGRFREAQNRYNSGLFDLRADTLSAQVKLPHLELRPLLENLYYPYSPYQFSVMGADILGSAYERFLGKVIDVPQPGRVVIEFKPAVRKAGGVYYTPGYIVRYLVQHTLGPLCEGRTPAQVAALRVLDPACGSGSFLLGAYEYLLNWHLLYYQAHPKAAAPPASSAAARAALPPAPKKNGKARPAEAVFTAAGQLSTAVRKRILLNNIFGVDLDEQAVEVSKLSLLLRCLEGETAQAPAAAQLAYDRLLPTLDANVRCGNSLVGPDYLDQPDPSPDVNPFDWHAEFADVFAQGGFDAVVGNPPYVRPHNIELEIKEYLRPRYVVFEKKADLYVCFFEQGLRLLKSEGRLGFIVGNGWLRLDSFQALRNYLLDNASVEQLIDFTNYVFEEANVKTMICLLRKYPQGEAGIIDCAVVDSLEFSLGNYQFNQIAKGSFRAAYKNNFDLSISQISTSIKDKADAESVGIGDVFQINFGLKTGDDSRFLSFKRSTHDHRPLLRGADIHRYQTEFKGEYVWYTPEEMKRHRSTARPGTAARFEQEKVLIRDTGGKLECTFDDENHFVKDVLVITPVVDADNGYPCAEYDLRFVCGILNSALMRYYYDVSFPTLHVQRDEIASLPLPILNLKNRHYHDAIVTQVTLLLALHPQLAAATVPSLRQPLATRVRRAEESLDDLVFDLYGLTAAERAVVRGEPVGVRPEPVA